MPFIPRFKSLGFSGIAYKNKESNSEKEYCSIPDRIRKEINGRRGLLFEQSDDRRGPTPAVRFRGELRSPGSFRFFRTYILWEYSRFLLTSIGR